MDYVSHYANDYIHTGIGIYTYTNSKIKTQIATLYTQYFLDFMMSVSNCYTGDC